MDTETNWTRAIRETDRYWAREASKAYEERRVCVRQALRESGGRSEPWMQYQLTRADYEAELRACCHCNCHA